MRPAGTAWSLLAAVAVSLGAREAAAQGLLLDAGYVTRSGPDLVALRAGYTAPLTGPVWWQLHGIILNDAGDGGVRRYGGGVELNAWRGGSGPYAAAGLDLGIEQDGPDDTWASWTVGGGYDLRVLPGLALSLDLKYRGFLNGDDGGVQGGVGLSYRWGSGKGSPKPATSAPTSGSASAPSATGASPPGSTAPPAAPAGSAALIRGDVVATARLAMGQPYKWGGQGDGGYDCSGLIQYAFATHGITVPRTSADQAQVGDPVEHLDQLEPGDILTFASSPGGTRTSHVGLYLGEGRFIHSASSRGVSESRLSADDPNGAWWFARFTGARRIITGQ